MNGDGGIAAYPVLTWGMERFSAALRGSLLLGVVWAIGLLAAGMTLARQQTVDLILVLAMDASASVDSQEFALQTLGFAEAFRHPDVIAAIRSVGDEGIAVAVVQWAGLGQQTVAVNWAVVIDQASGEAMAAQIETAGRKVVGATRIDKALQFSTKLLANAPYRARRQVIDVSGDGKSSNFGASTGRARDAALAAGITVNGLAILNEVPDLGLYYGGEVVGGAGSFLMTATDFRDFATAIRLKLILEIRGAPLA